jgi:hypothetical protein
MDETTDQLNERCLRLNAEYQVLAEKMRQMMKLHTAEGKRQLEEVFVQLDAVYLKLSRVQTELRERLKNK